MTMDKPWGRGLPLSVRDATANDSDKTVMTVGTGKLVLVTAIWVEYTCSPDVGTRYVTVDLTDGTNLICRVGTTVAFAAGQTRYLIMSLNAPPSATAMGAALTTYLSVLPLIVLREGYVVRVYDASAVAVAADGMTVVIHYVEYDA